MKDFMDLYTAAAYLGITHRTFERHVKKINEDTNGPAIIKVKRPGETKFYYSASDVNRVRAHIDSRFGPVKRPGDDSPQLGAAA